VRDGLRNFNREPEVIRHRLSPSLPGFRFVRPIERGIDLGAIEYPTVPLQVSALGTNKRVANLGIVQPAQPMRVGCILVVEVLGR
jgi:hypothetical protein